MHLLTSKCLRPWRSAVILACGLALLCSAQTPPPEPADKKPEPKAWFEVYGFVMADAGYDFKQVNPDWYDVLRPTKLPAYKDEFGADGNTWFSVRQSRFGVKSETPTRFGPLKTHFEFELFGTGVDAGQTTFRLRYAYGELGHFGAGQTVSPFMDGDVFPNSLEYWGPNGMVFFRNIQVRWMPLMGDNSLTFALERPGASADGGVYADRVELQDIKPHFPMPDISGAAKFTRKWGYFRSAGILRRIEWTDLGQQQYDLSGGVWGWGINLSTNLKTGKKGVFRGQFSYGAGVENYMNDAPVDIGAQRNFSDPVTPLTGKALPVLGVVAFYDHNWSDKWSSTIGYSRLDIDNSNAQTNDAFKSGQYALTNLLWYPVKNVMVGGEFQFGYRTNFRDGWSVPDYRLQFSFKYSYSHRWSFDVPKN